MISDCKCRVAWTAYTYDSLNGHCGNCSIILSSKVHNHDRKQKSNYSIVDSFVSLPIDSVFVNLSKERIPIQSYSNNLR